MVIGKVAKQVRQRWKGYAWLIDNGLVRNSSSKKLEKKSTLFQRLLVIASVFISVLME